MAQDPLKPKDNGKIGLPRVDSAMNKLPPGNKEGGKGGKKEKRGKEAEDDGDQKLLARARKRFDRCIKAESDNRKHAAEDLKFLDGDQWPADVSAQRNADKRPCLTINKLKTFVHQVTNSQRENRPAINISPVGEGSDIEAAKMYSGLIRSIERDSAADIAYDTAFFNSAANGFGYWRVMTDYENEDTFNQVITIKRVRNPFTVYLDPDACEPDGSDAKYGFVTEMIPKDEFEDQYPDAQLVSFTLSGIGDSYKEWVDKDRVRVAEYYEVDVEMADLVHLSTGHTGFKDELSDEVKDQIKSGSITIEDERKSERHSTKWYKLTALDILDSTDVPTGGMIPIVKVIGDEIDREGKVTYSGIVRDAKDPQRMYNYWKTTEAEIVALQPKAPFILEEGQVEGHETQWKQANIKAFPYMLYKGTNIGGKPAPPPQRQMPPQAPAAVLQAMQGSAEDMMAVTGIRFDANTPERAHDESGKQLMELRRNTEVGSFHYVDNLARSLKYSGKLIIKMIPKIYDTKRTLMILREDGKEQMIQVDPHADKSTGQGKTAAGAPLPIFNPNIGKYGVTVTVGPSYATKRIESAQQMMQFVAAMPETGKIVSDLIAKNMDWPGAEQFAVRLAKTIPPQFLMPDMKGVPPEIQAKMQASDMQMHKMGQQMMAMQKMLQDQTADRMILQEKNNNDMEAKILAIVQKMEAADAKNGVDHMATTGAHTLELLKMLKPQEPQQPMQGDPQQEQPQNPQQPQ